MFKILPEHIILRLFTRKCFKFQNSLKHWLLHPSSVESQLFSRYIFVNFHFRKIIVISSCRLAMRPTSLRWNGTPEAFGDCTSGGIPGNLADIIWPLTDNALRSTVTPNVVNFQFCTSNWSCPEIERTTRRLRVCPFVVFTWTPNLPLPPSCH